LGRRATEKNISPILLFIKSAIPRFRNNSAETKHIHIHQKMAE